jgi:hypothetical protein
VRWLGRFVATVVYGFQSRYGSVDSLGLHHRGGGSWFLPLAREQPPQEGGVVEATFEPKIAEWKPEPLWVRTCRTGMIWIWLALLAVMTYQLVAFGLDGMANYHLVFVGYILLQLVAGPLARRRLPRPKCPLYYKSKIEVWNSKEQLGTDTGYLWFEGRIVRIEGVRLSLTIDSQKLQDANQMPDKPASFYGHRIEGSESFLAFCIEERVPCSDRTWSSATLFSEAAQREIGQSIVEQWPPLKAPPLPSEGYRMALVSYFAVLGLVCLSFIVLNVGKRDWWDLGLALFVVALAAFFISVSWVSKRKEQRVAQG